EWVPVLRRVARVQRRRGLEDLGVRVDLRMLIIAGFIEPVRLPGEPDDLFLPFLPDLSAQVPIDAFPAIVNALHEPRYLQETTGGERPGVRRAANRRNQELAHPARPPERQPGVHLVSRRRGGGRIVEVATEHAGRDV